MGVTELLMLRDWWEHNCAPHTLQFPLVEYGIRVYDISYHSYYETQGYLL